MLLNSNGIRTLRRTKPLAVFAVISGLPFGGVNLSQGSEMLLHVGIRKCTPMYFYQRMPFGSVQYFV